MWKTQRLTERGWEPDRELPTEDDAVRYWRKLVFSLDRTPMRLVDDRGVVMDEMNTERSES